MDIKRIKVTTGDTLGVTYNLRITQRTTREKVLYSCDSHIYLESIFLNSSSVTNNEYILDTKGRMFLKNTAIYFKQIEYWS